MNVKMAERRGYRLSVDDVIWAFQDIAQHSEYTSIFDNPFFALYKRVHDVYGTKVHMNIYYETVEKDFNLSMFPDKYKNEWKENAHWLHLSFHGLADKPNWPYREAGYDKVKHDCDLVMEQILRFAGPEVTGPVTTLHFGDATAEGVQALYDCGIRVIQSEFMTSTGEPLPKYGLSDEELKQVRYDTFWKDPKSGMIYYGCDAILNKRNIEDIGPWMDEFQEKYPDRPFVDVLIHEQYFYPHYKRYLADYEERVVTGVKWCHEHGYAPCFVTEMLEMEDVKPW